MQPPAVPDSRHRSRRRRAARLARALLCCALAGCATGAGDAERAAAQLRATNRLAAALHRGAAPALEAGELRVRLAFAVDADLDLYVTDPHQETVYFANSPSRSGGSLVRDLRCAKRTSSDEVRIESVRFPAAQPGRYRVGVDFSESCTGVKTVPFVVVLEYGAVRREARGAIELHRFLPILIEEDVAPRVRESRGR